MTILPSSPQAQAVRNQQYLNPMLYNEDENRQENIEKNISDLSAVLEFMSFQKKKFCEILKKNGGVLESLSLTLRGVREEKAKKKERLAKRERLLFKKENVDDVFTEIQLLSDTSVGLKVLCARYSNDYKVTLLKCICL